MISFMDVQRWRAHKYLNSFIERTNSLALLAASASMWAHVFPDLHGWFLWNKTSLPEIPFLALAQLLSVIGCSTYFLYKTVAKMEIS